MFVISKWFYKFDNMKKKINVFIAHFWKANQFLENKIYLLLSNIL